MKKLLFLMLAIMLMISLCGCGASQGTAKSTPDPRAMPEYHFTEAVQERGVLTISVSNNSSLNYAIPDDTEKYGELAGTRDGYIPEMCRQIAKELGVEAEFVEYETLKAQLNAVATGEVDIAADNLMINEERLAIYEMTDRFDVVDVNGDDVYLSTNPQPWLPLEEEEESEEKESSNSNSEPTATPVEPEPREMIKNEEELAHARIAVIKGSVQVTNTAKQYPEAELYELTDNNAILEALISGTVDAGVFTTIEKTCADQITEAILEGTVAQSDYEIKVPDYRGNGLILMKGNEDLCQSINEILSDLRESEWLKKCYEAEMSEAKERGIV